MLLARPPLHILTYRAGSTDDGAGATAGGGAGAGAHWGDFLRVLAVWAWLFCFLLVLQLIDLDLAGIAQGCVRQRVYIWQNPREAGTDHSIPIQELQSQPRDGQLSPQTHLLGVSPLMSHFIISLTKSPREE